MQTRISTSHSSQGASRRWRALIVLLDVFQTGTDLSLATTAFFPTVEAKRVIDTRHVRSVPYKSYLERGSRPMALADDAEEYIGTMDDAHRFNALANWDVTAFYHSKLAARPPSTAVGLMPQRLSIPLPHWQPSLIPH
jgi:hypothetical protein